MGRHHALLRRAACVACLAGARAQKLVQQLYDVDFVLYNYSHADLPL